MMEHDGFLRRSGLAQAQRWTPLAGGVSSDIWCVELAGGDKLCVKRALPKLKVAADWEAPISRNAYEWEWMRFAAEILPDVVPRPLAHDPSAGLFAMSFLDPVDHPVWKQQLLDGQIDVDTAGAVGHAIGTLHAASARRDDLANAFDTAENFHALRLEPYLLATGRQHPSLASRLEELVDRTARTRIALVHGDVSPKNILVGPKGPVLLDAECAWYGDPAFDVAFCLNHLLLEGAAATRPRSRVAAIVRRLRQRVLRSSRVRATHRAGRTRRRSPARAPARPRGRQVSGRVCDRRHGSGSRSRCGHPAAAKAVRAPDRRRRCRVSEARPDDGEPIHLKETLSCPFFATHGIAPASALT